jgi:hypothetical protein
MTRWSRPKSETPSARHTLARDAYAVHYGHIKDIVQALNNDQFDWLCADIEYEKRRKKLVAPVSPNT